MSITLHFMAWIGTDVAGFINDTALVLYVYLPGSWNGEESCLTVRTFDRLVILCGND